MKPAKQCKDRSEDIVAFVMGELDADAGRELQSHLAACDTCRASYDALVEEENESPIGFRGICSQPRADRAIGVRRRSPIERACRRIQQPFP